jgi:hypothetical protein
MEDHGLWPITRICPVCGREATKECLCGKQVCPVHIYDIGGTELCAECIDEIPEC